MIPQRETSGGCGIVQKMMLGEGEMECGFGGER
jgi:hypothetical protein